MKDETSFLSKIPDTVKLNFFRWWFFGAIFFLIGWGTGLGMNSYVDLIFFMGLGIGVGNVFVFNPLAYSVFDVERNGKLVNKKYYERTVLEGVMVKLGEIFKCLICSTLVFFVYQGINMALIAIFNLNKEEMAFYLEPIFYGIFFLMFYLIISKITDKISLALEKKSGVGK